MRLGLIGVGLVGVVSGCAAGSGDARTAATPSASAPDDAEVGTGFLDVGDLGSPSAKGHFVGEAKMLKARLGLGTNGCVTVVVDGVERIPVWPEGTEVAQDPADLARYVVTLPGHLILTVDAASADEFSALGVIDENSAPFGGTAGTPSSKIGSFLAFCGVKAAPVAFRDPTSIRAR